MKQRITITLSDEIVRKVRKEQSKLIVESKGAVFFGSVVEMLLKEALAK